jgi:hypothetical protein
MRVDRIETLLFALLATVVALMIMIAFVSVAAAVTLCNERPKPGTGSHWFWREIDGKPCWFQSPGLRRGQDMPKSELRWRVEPPPPQIKSEVEIEEPPPKQPSYFDDAFEAVEEERLRYMFLVFGR